MNELLRLLTPLDDSSAERRAAELTLLQRHADLDASALPPWSDVKPATLINDPAFVAEPADAVIQTLHARLESLRNVHPGVGYTPRWLADLMADRALAHAEGGPGLRVLDVGCGTGVLAAAWLRAAVADAPEHADRVLAGLRGEEIRPGPAAVARRVMTLAAHLAGAPLDRAAACIHTADSLADAAEGGFDVILGNPPYAFSARIEPTERKALAERFEMARGRHVDLFRVFFEATLNRLRPGGVHVFIVPDALLARDDLAPLRRWLLQRADLVELHRCGKPFIAWTHWAQRRTVGVGAVVTVLRKHLASHDAARHGVAPVHTSAPERQAALAMTTLPTEAIGDDGGPWSVHAPSWWFGDDGLAATLGAAPATVADILADGTVGSTRGEELGKSALSSLTIGLEAVYTGEEVYRGTLTPPDLGIDPVAIIKDRSFYAGPRVLVVKTGATPVAVADNSDIPVLQSVYILHTDPAARWEPYGLAAWMSCAWVAAWTLCQWTGARTQHPQLTIGNLRSLPLPHPSRRAYEDLRALSVRWHRLPLHAIAERAKLEWDIDTLVGRWFSLDLPTWYPRLVELLAPLPSTQRPTWIEHPPNLR